MSKTVDHNLIRDPELIDVADESWAEELPVEEAILPAGGAPSLADENEDGVEISQPEKMTWTELGLDEYR